MIRDKEDRMREAASVKILVSQKVNMHILITIYLFSFGLFSFWGKSKTKLMTNDR